MSEVALKKIQDFKNTIQSLKSKFETEHDYPINSERYTSSPSRADLKNISNSPSINLLNGSQPLIVPNRAFKSFESAESTRTFGEIPPRYMRPSPHRPNISSPHQLPDCPVGSAALTAREDFSPAFRSIPLKLDTGLGLTKYLNEHINQQKILPSHINIVGDNNKCNFYENSTSPYNNQPVSPSIPLPLYQYSPPIHHHYFPPPASCMIPPHISSVIGMSPSSLQLKVETRVFPNNPHVSSSEKKNKSSNQSQQVKNTTASKPEGTKKDNYRSNNNEVANDTDSRAETTNRGRSPPLHSSTEKKKKSKKDRHRLEDNDKAMTKNLCKEESRRKQFNLRRSLSSSDSPHLTASTQSQAMVHSQNETGNDHLLSNNANIATCVKHISPPQASASVENDGVDKETPSSLILMSSSARSADSADLRNKANEILMRRASQSQQQNQKHNDELSGVDSELTVSHLNSELRNNHLPESILNTHINIDGKHGSTGSPTTLNNRIFIKDNILIDASSSCVIPHSPPRPKPRINVEVAHKRIYSPKTPQSLKRGSELVADHHQSNRDNAVVVSVKHEIVDLHPENNKNTETQNTVSLSETHTGDRVFEEKITISLSPSRRAAHEDVMMTSSLQDKNKQDEQEFADNYNHRHHVNFGVQSTFSPKRGNVRKLSNNAGKSGEEDHYDDDDDVSTQIKTTLTYSNYTSNLGPPTSFSNAPETQINIDSTSQVVFSPKHKNEINQSQIDSKKLDQVRAEWLMARQEAEDALLEHLKSKKADENDSKNINIKTPLATSPDASTFLITSANAPHSMGLNSSLGGFSPLHQQINRHTDSSSNSSTDDILNHVHNNTVNLNAVNLEKKNPSDSSQGRNGFGYYELSKMNNSASLKGKSSQFNSSSNGNDSTLKYQPNIEHMLVDQILQGKRILEDNVTGGQRSVALFINTLRSSSSAASLSNPNNNFTRNRINNGGGEFNLNKEVDNSAPLPPHIERIVKRLHTSSTASSKMKTSNSSNSTSFNQNSNSRYSLHNSQQQPTKPRSSLKRANSRTPNTISSQPKTTIRPGKNHNNPPSVVPSSTSPPPWLPPGSPSSPSRTLLRRGQAAYTSNGLEVDYPVKKTPFAAPHTRIEDAVWVHDYENIAQIVKDPSSSALLSPKLLDGSNSTMNYEKIPNSNAFILAPHYRVRRDMTPPTKGVRRRLSNPSPSTKQFATVSMQTCSSLLFAPDVSSPNLPPSKSEDFTCQASYGGASENLCASVQNVVSNPAGRESTNSGMKTDFHVNNKTDCSIKMENIKIEKESEDKITSLKLNPTEILSTSSAVDQGISALDSRNGLNISFGSNINTERKNELNHNNENSRTGIEPKLPQTSISNIRSKAHSILNSQKNVQECVQKDQFKNNITSPSSQHPPSHASRVDVTPSMPRQVTATVDSSASKKGLTKDDQQLPKRSTQSYVFGSVCPPVPVPQQSAYLPNIRFGEEQFENNSLLDGLPVSVLGNSLSPHSSANNGHSNINHLFVHHIQHPNNNSNNINSAPQQYSTQFHHQPSIVFSPQMPVSPSTTATFQIIPQAPPPATMTLYSSSPQNIGEHHYIQQVQQQEQQIVYHDDYKNLHHHYPSNFNPMAPASTAVSPQVTNDHPVNAPQNAKPEQPNPITQPFNLPKAIPSPLRPTPNILTAHLVASVGNKPINGCAKSRNYNTSQYADVCSDPHFESEKISTSSSSCSSRPVYSDPTASAGPFSSSNIPSNQSRNVVRNNNTSENDQSPYPDDGDDDSPSPANPALSSTSTPPRTRALRSTLTGDALPLTPSERHVDRSYLPAPSSPTPSPVRRTPTRRVKIDIYPQNTFLQQHDVDIDIGNDCRSIRIKSSSRNNEAQLSSASVVTDGADKANLTTPNDYKQSKISNLAVGKILQSTNNIPIPTIQNQLNPTAVTEADLFRTSSSGGTQTTTISPNFVIENTVQQPHQGLMRVKPIASFPNTTNINYDSLNAARNSDRDWLMPIVVKPRTKNN